MTTPNVIIVGADKGGVGKTMTTRALLDYFKTNVIKTRAFDTESPTGMLKRFYPEETEIVDLTDSDGQMKVFDTLGAAVTIIDIRAGLLSPTLKTLAEIGFIDPSKCKLTVMHVLGNTQNSLDEVKSITNSISSSRYVGVGNRINDTKFNFPPGSLDIPMLNSRACEAIDSANMSFHNFIASETASSVLRGYVRHWLAQVFSEFDKAKMNVL